MGFFFASNDGCCHNQPETVCASGGSSFEAMRRSSDDAVYYFSLPRKNFFPREGDETESGLFSDKVPREFYVLSDSFLGLKEQVLIFSERQFCIICAEYHTS